MLTARSNGTVIMVIEKMAFLPICSLNPDRLALHFPGCLATFGRD